MRILHILNELKPSGAETMLRIAAGHWQARGIEGEILAIGERPGEYATQLERAGYRVHHLRFRRSARFLLEVFRFFRTHRFDGVHIHCERGNLWYALLAFAAGERRIARTIHSSFAFGGRLRASRWLQRWFLRRCLGVRSIAVGPSVRDAEWKTYRNPAEALLNWYDDSRFQIATVAERAAARKALRISDDSLVLITVGNCSEVKNHVAVIRALAILPPSLDLLYLHAGCEEEARTDQRLAAELGVSHRIRFLGPVLDIPALLKAADLYLMPSLREGFSIAAAEAMAAGLPVVLGNVAGLRDLRDIAPNGEWVKPEADAIAPAILRFARMGEEARQAIGRELSARIRTHCSVEVGAGRYASLYGEMTRS